MSELERCPFCGGEAQFVCISKVGNAEDFGKCFKIQCKYCGAKCPITFTIYASINNDGTVKIEATDRENAIAAWNRRAD